MSSRLVVAVTLAVALVVTTVLVLLTTVPVTAEERKKVVCPYVKKVGGTLIVIHWGDPKSFNPDAQVDDAGYPLFCLIFNRLVALDANYNVVPDLAYKWEVSPDGKVYTFYLYPNATWHDGKPVTAWDVKFTFECIKKFRGIAYGIIKAENIEKIEVVDNHTVRFYLKEPFAPFLTFLAWYGTFIIPKHIYEKYKNWMDPKNPALTKPIGSGPFKFKEWVRGDHITLVANEKYFRGRPGLDKIIFKIVPDPVAALQTFLAEGHLLMHRPPLSEVPKLMKRPDVIVNIRPVPSRWYIGFNLRNPILAIREVRLAIAMAINRSLIVQKALAGFGKPAETAYTPAIAWACNPNARLPPYNPEKAKEILDKLGFIDRDGDGIRETPEGKKLIFRFVIWPGAEEEAIANIIKEELKKIGIGIKIESYEIATWEEKVVKKHDFDIALCDGFQGPDPDNMRFRFAPGYYINFAGYNNTEFKKLLEEAARTVDKEKRRELYFKAQEIFAHDLAYLPLADLVVIRIYKPGFHNWPWEKHMIGKVHYYSLWQVWWEGGKPVEEYLGIKKPAAKPAPPPKAPAKPAPVGPAVPTTIIVAVVIVVIAVAVAAVILLRRRRR